MKKNLYLYMIKPFKSGPFTIDFEITHLNNGTTTYNVINYPSFVDILPKKIEIKPLLYLSVNTTA